MNQIEKSRISKIKTLHGEVKASLKMSLEKAIQIGRLLTKQKKITKHGDWLKWIKSNMPFKQPTAWAYMQMYERRKEFEIINVYNLTGAYKALNASRPEQEEMTEHEENMKTVYVTTVKQPEQEEKVVNVIVEQPERKEKMVNITIEQPESEADSENRPRTIRFPIEPGQEPEEQPEKQQAESKNPVLSENLIDFINVAKSADKFRHKLKKQSAEIKKILIAFSDPTKSSKYSSFYISYESDVGNSMKQLEELYEELGKICGQEKKNSQ